MTAFSSLRRQRDNHLRPTLWQYAVANDTLVHLLRQRSAEQSGGFCFIFDD